ncbi:MAG: hypothetical protein MUF72_07280, partial [Elainella sp. Prado103]|nr:hypothetical protein [Elainella sp. Prado103]
ADRLSAAPDHERPISRGTLSLPAITSQQELPFRATISCSGFLLQDGLAIGCESCLIGLECSTAAWQNPDSSQKFLDHF